MSAARCPVCGHTDSLPEPAKGTCAHCYNHMVYDVLPVLCEDCGSRTPLTHNEMCPKLLGQYPSLPTTTKGE